VDVGGVGDAVGGHRVARRIWPFGRAWRQDAADRRSFGGCGFVKERPDEGVGDAAGVVGVAGDADVGWFELVELIVPNLHLAADQLVDEEAVGDIPRWVWFPVAVVF